MQEQLPALPYEAWRDTKDTLHLWCQILGKIRMAHVPPRNHWWNVALGLSVRGITTGRLRQGDVVFEIELDLLSDRLVIRTDRGDVGGFPLKDGLSVAEFYSELSALLRSMGVHAEIVARPYGVPMTTPFAEDLDHAAFDADAVRRFWQVLNWTDWIFQEFAGWFCGKTSPVNIFWHSFDLAVTRFSGRRVPIPAGTDPVEGEAYSHEVISFGFWAGDEKVRAPTFYSYTAPEPKGLTAQLLQPAQARWKPAGGMANLPYEVVRASADPALTLMNFLESAYEAGAQTAHWDRRSLTSSWCPTVPLAPG